MKPTGKESPNQREWNSKLDLVVCILNHPTADLLKGLSMIDLGITTPDTLKDLASLICEKAAVEPTFCPLYAQFCSDLERTLPSFASDEPGGKAITFKQVLVVNCLQEAVDGADKLRQMTASERRDRESFLGNIRLVGELFKHKMVPQRIVRRIVEKLVGAEDEPCPEEMNVEAICQLLHTIGKQLDDETPNINDAYFIRLKELSTYPNLALHLRIMIWDLLHLRSNNWVPTREEVKAKTIGGNPVESLRVRNTDELKRKTLFLLKKYFRGGDLDEALQRVQELESLEYRPEFVKEAISLALKKIPPCVQPVTKLLDYLSSNNLLTKPELRAGCLCYGSFLYYIILDVHDLPSQAPESFGEIMGHLVVSGGIDFKVVEEVVKMVNKYYRKDVFNGVLNFFWGRCFAG